MKKWILLIFLVAGCVSIPSAPPEFLRNENCLDSSKIKVLQVLDKGILAYLCPVTYPMYYEDAFDACSARGDLVAMAVNPADNDYVDDQKVSLIPQECFTGNGTYTYYTKDKIRKTVRLIEVVDSFVRNPAFNQHLKSN